LYFSFFLSFFKYQQQETREPSPINQGIYIHPFSFSYFVQLSFLKTLISINIEKKNCDSCGTPQTPRWRKGPKSEPLCNNCYMRWLRAGRKETVPPPGLVFFFLKKKFSF